MAYKNLISQACADKNELFTRVRDFICKRNGTYDYSTLGIGWTLHDSSYATDEDNCAINDWYVIFSAGEGTEDDLYFKMAWISGYIKIQGYLMWDATTHAGGQAYNTAYNWSVDEANAKTLWLYGDLDSIVGVHKLPAIDYRVTQFGKLGMGWTDLSGTIARCGATLSAGSDVSITVDAVPANWAVGREIYIRTTHNNAVSTAKIEKIEIKTLAGNTITADLVNSYTSSARLSDFVGYYCANSNQGAGPCIVLIGGNGSLAQTLTYTYLALTTSYFDPTYFEDRFYLMQIFANAICGLEGFYPHIRRVPNFTAGFTYEDVLQEADGTQWRCFKMYTNAYVAIKEV